jgi:hypothetical protein
MAHQPQSRASLDQPKGDSLQVDPQNSTALKWCSDGELSPLDLRRIIDLLSQADPVAEALISDRRDTCS